MVEGLLLTSITIVTCSQGGLTEGARVYLETDFDVNTDTATVRFLTGRVAVVRWQGYSFTVSQVRWGGFRRWLYTRVYHHDCPPSDVRFETSVFLSHGHGRFNPQKPLHTTFQKNRDEARTMIRQLAEQVAEGRLAFQTFFQKS